MKKGVFFALCCVIVCCLGGCSGNTDKPLMIVTNCGDTIYFRASAITADCGEVYLRTEYGTGYVDDVCCVVPMSEEDYNKKIWQ